jgi:ketosteroid isomerase-like protein
MTIRTVLKDLTAHYVNALEQGDAIACGANFAENASFLFRGGSVQGREDIVALHEHFIRAGVKMLKIETLESENFGDLGYAVQSYATANEMGRILLVLKRQEDDTWKIQVQSVTSV